MVERIFILTKLKQSQREGIEDAVCVGISDDTWGQVPILYYVTNQDINQTELIEHFENHLARYKIPKNIIRSNLYLIHRQVNYNVKRSKVKT